MKKASYLSNLLYVVGGILFIFALWIFISLVIIKDNEMLFPTPWATFSYLFEILKIKNTYLNILHSFIRMIIGYGISIILALILGTISGLIIPFRKLLNPTIVMLKSIPTACLLFLFIVLVGFKDAPIFVVILVSFPILYDSVVGGLDNISTNLADALKLDGGDKLQNIFKVRLPLASNFIMVGIISSFSLAFKVEIMSEILAGSTSYGIGSRIKQIQANEVSLTGIFAWALIAIILMIIVDYIIRLLKRKLNLTK